MNEPEDYLEKADLHGALLALTNRVKAKPADYHERLFLFQLLSVMGDWDRALTHLNVAADMDNDAGMMGKMYRAALQCMALREEVFAGKRSPLVFGEPDEWVGMITQVPGLAARGEFAAAADLRDQALADAPGHSGTLNEEPFEWVMDADSRIGPMFEMILNGKYYWVPMHRVRELRMTPPEFLKEAVWLQADVMWANMGQATVLLPTRYPGTAAAGDGELSLARSTAWREPLEGFSIGLGQRTLATDERDVPLSQVQSLKLDLPTPELTAEDISTLSDEITAEAEESGSDG